MKTKLSTVTAFLALFVFTVAIQTVVINMQPVKVFADAKSDAKSKACKYIPDKKACEEWFDLGYEGTKRSKAKKNTTTPEGICGKAVSAGTRKPTIENGPSRPDEQKGCYEGVNFFNAQQGKDVPEGSDIESGEDDKKAKESCDKLGFKDGSKQKECIVGLSGGIAGGDVDEVCKGKGEACKKGFEAGKVEAAGKTGEELDCDTKLESVLSWIACPLIDMGVYFTDFVFRDFVQPMLENVPVSTDPNDGSYKAWQQFRLLANIMIIGSLMVIVYSQAKGGGGK